VSTSNYDGNPIAYLAAFKEKLEPLCAQEEWALLKPDLADLYATDRAAFAMAANLIKEKLGIGRRDLEAGIKPLCEGDGNSSQATRLVELAEQIRLFHTPDGEAWATLPLGEHQEHWAIRSKGFDDGLPVSFMKKREKHQDHKLCKIRSPCSKGKQCMKEKSTVSLSGSRNTTASCISIWQILTGKP
jgi:hypothetical protein